MQTAHFHYDGSDKGALLRVLVGAAKRFATELAWRAELRGCELVPQAEPFQTGQHLLHEIGNFL